MPDRSDSSVITTGETADDNHGLFALGFDLIGGFGTFDDLSEVIALDSTPVAVRGGGWGFLIRTRAYVGPIGVLTFFDYSGEDEDRDGVYYASEMISLRFLGSLWLKPFPGRFHLEPLVGYGWLKDRVIAEVAGESTAELGRVQRESWGFVIGSEQRVRVNQELWLVGIYTYGHHANADHRVNLELRWEVDEELSAEEGEKPGSGLVFIGCRGYWRGDGRSGIMIYAGFGGFGWF